MQNQLKISFENMGVSSYLTITFSQDMPVVGYQIEMITSNQISHTLEVSKRMVNGNVVAYYNISSRIKLSQILERRKLTRSELLCLIQGAVKAIQDGEEYQLPEDGFVMDPEYIYVTPDTCSPAFLYIPVSGEKTSGIRGFLTDLIVHGKIEMSSDNFIQVLLEALNETDFSAEKLAACIAPYQEVKRNSPHFLSSDFSKRQMPDASAVGSGIEYGTETVEKIKTPVIPEPVVSPSVKAESKEETDGKPRFPETGKQENKPKPGKSRPQAKQKAKTAKKITDIPEEQAEDFDREKAKKKFLLPQAAIMVALAAVGSFGGFLDKSGNIAVNNILAAVVIVAVTEVILYREAYVNNKGKKDAKKKKENKEGRKEKAEKKPLPGKKSPSVPGKREFVEREPVKAQTVQPNTITPNSIPVQPPVRSVPTQPVSPMVSMAFDKGADETEISSETELWESEQTGAAYLEHYVNGIMNRIPLTKTGTLIGRLASQVDYAVANPKVGKIHAEFINQNGTIAVVDQNSKNGTYINRSGQRINSNVPYPLKDGDIISLADSEFVIRYGFR